MIQGRGEARNDLGAIRGLSRRRPALALCMLVFLLAQAGVPFTSGFLAKFYVISAAVQRGQYALAVIAMLAAAVAAFFYLRVALLMYSGDPAGAAGDPDQTILGAGGPVTDGTLTAGLQPVPSLDGGAAGATSTTATLEAPSEDRITVPALVGLALALCVAFTIFAGVSSPVITFARQATLLF